MAQKEIKKKNSAKGSTTKSKNKKRSSGSKRKNSFRDQNLVALFLLVFGMVFLLSIMTNALGSVGTGIRAILLGQFAGIAALISLVMIIVGAARLVYSSKFELNDIPIMLPVLTLFACTVFYGAIHLAKFQELSPSLDTVKKVFVQSIVGENIGIFPYLISYGLFSLIGRLGMFLLSITIFLFIVIFYFKLSFSKLGDASIALATEGKKVATGLKRKTMDYITVNEQDTMEKEAPRANREKLDETFIEQKYGFLERYKSEIAEFTEFSSKTAEGRSDTDGMDLFHGTEAEDSSDSYHYSVEKDEEAEASSRQHSANETMSLGDEPVFTDDRKEERAGEDPSEEDSLQDFPVARFGISVGETSDETKVFKSLAQDLREAERMQSAFVDPVQQKQAFDIVDKRLVHQKDQLEKENIGILGTQEQEKPIVLPGKKYILPTTSLLKKYKVKQKGQSQQLKDAQKLESTLQIFGIEAKVVNIAIGPTITRYELSLKVGTKVSRILNLSDDLALALAAVAPIRIEAPIPGTSLIGIELPNAETDIVSFRAMLEAEAFQASKAKLPVALGKDVSGKAIIADIAKMPHVLVAGATGSGKSVCINTLICSILYKSKPDEVKLIMIDPKMVELSVYNEIPHLLVPVVTDMKKAPYALSWAVSEMNKRYKLFAENKVRDLDGYNAIPSVEKMPRIVIVVDELADLMMVSPNEVEDSIIRLAQKARACGMHLVIATQRPSVDVITGLIKANIPTRIAFAVSSQVDSRTILDQVGAEKLIGKGDMLFSHLSVAKPQRIQGALILDDEVNAVVDFILKQGHAAPQSENLIEEEIKSVEAMKDEEDPLLDEILEFAIQNKQISTSLIQRRFRIGYNRASRIIDRMEEMGVVSESDGAKPRRVISGAIKENNSEIEAD